MRVLITGGAGFIGSHLVEAYLARGDEVYILDDLSTGTLENIRHLQEHETYGGRLFVTVDTVLHDDKTLELVGTCDIVVHLAAAVGVQYILDNPLTSIVTNVRGAETILELCSKFKKKVLIASTSEVYGMQNHAPLKETDYCVYGPSTKSRWSYAASKLIDEFTALAYHRTKKLPVVIVRLFNTVGPRQTWRYGMDVKDVTKVLVTLLDAPEAIGEVINVGGTEEVSILQLAKRVKARAGSTSEIKLLPYSEVYPKDFEDMQRRVPSTDKLKRLIGYTPGMKLDQILDDTINYYRGGTGC